MEWMLEIPPKAQSYFWNGLGKEKPEAFFSAGGGACFLLAAARSADFSALS